MAFKLTFENKVIERTTKSAFIKTAEAGLFAISSEILFEIYPFMIVFDEDMIIQNVGKSMEILIPDLVNKKISEVFHLIKPIIDFSFYSIRARSTNIFVLKTCKSIDELIEDEEVYFKGQMLHLTDWNVIMYLCTPVLKDFDSLTETGLFLNDMSSFDVSRDFVCANAARVSI